MDSLKLKVESLPVGRQVESEEVIVNSVQPVCCRHVDKGRDGQHQLFN